MPPNVQAVRELLQDAALSVPEEPDAASAQEFLAALRAAYHGLGGFLADPPPSYALEEAMAAPEALDEAIQVLQAALRSLP